MSLPPPPPVSSLLLNRGPNPFLLKKPIIKVEFSDIILPTNFIGKSATVIMRNLDTYRMYTPLESEQSKYNLPNERMVLNNRLSLMYLCGGFAGMRFTSEDMLYMSTISTTLTDNYNLVDNYFQNMSSTSKKIAMPVSVSVDTISTPISTVASESISETIPLPVQQSDTTLPPVPPSSTTTPIDPEQSNATVIIFNGLVTDYLSTIHEMQTFVRNKQIEFMKNKDSEGMCMYMCVCLCMYMFMWVDVRAYIHVV